MGKRRSLILVVVLTLAVIGTGAAFAWLYDEAEAVTAAEVGRVDAALTQTGDTAWVLTNTGTLPVYARLGYSICAIDEDGKIPMTDTGKAVLKDLSLTIGGEKLHGAVEILSTPAGEKRFVVLMDGAAYYVLAPGQSVYGSYCLNTDVEETEIQWSAEVLAAAADTVRDAAAYGWNPELAREYAPVK